MSRFLTTFGINMLSLSWNSKYIHMNSSNSQLEKRVLQFKSKPERKISKLCKLFTGYLQKSREEIIFPILRSKL